MRQLSPNERDVRRLAESIAKLTRTRTAELTLTASATSTTVSDPSFVADDVPTLTPTTANAAAALATTYVSARDNGLITITHANNAQTDRIFLVRWGS